jgi:Rps23 Pro-64 3,4-dihydroxylase Tpa1-like proline 4-hydroxylase
LASAPSLIPPHLVVDGFLEAADHAALLAHAVDLGEGHFVRAQVREQGQAVYRDSRTTLTSARGLGALKETIRAPVRARLPEFFEALKIAPFPIEHIELELAAHGDGHYFQPHTDTLTGMSRGVETDRVVTMVYYFHRHPRRFSGGELAIYPFGEGDPVLIDPSDNRLVALPAFARHEVRPVSCPECEFADSRFAVSIWLHRRRAAPSSAPGE